MIHLVSHGTDYHSQSLNKAFAAYEEKYDVKLQVKYTSVDELKENVEKNAHDILSFVHLKMATGDVVVGSPLDNQLFPDWNPKPVSEYV